MSWNLDAAKNRQSTQKLSHTRHLRGNAFKGDILWHFDFSTKNWAASGGGHTLALQHDGQNYFLLVT